MNDLTKRMDKITKNFSEVQNLLFLDNRFPYLMSKADVLLSIGVQQYRQNDAFKMPSSDWSSADIDLVKNGCAQILNGIGFMEDIPFTNLGVRGFNLLFTTFHFKSMSRKTKRLGKGRMIDAITFEHHVTKEKVVYYNLVES